MRTFHFLALYPPPIHPPPPLRRIPHLVAHRKTFSTTDIPHHPSYTSSARNLSSTTPLVPPHDGLTNAQVLQAQPLFAQYLFFLFLVSVSTLAFHLPIRMLCALDPAKIPGGLLRGMWNRAVPWFEKGDAALSTALIVSSCTKLFPILLIIWDYDLPSSATAVSWAVIVNNIAALEILMDCGYLRAGILVGVGAGVRGMLSWGILRAAGLGTGWEEFGRAGLVESVQDWAREMVGMW